STRSGASSGSIDPRAGTAAIAPNRHLPTASVIHIRRSARFGSRSCTEKQSSWDRLDPALSRQRGRTTVRPGSKSLLRQELRAPTEHCGSSMKSDDVIVSLDERSSDRRGQVTSFGLAHIFSTGAPPPWPAHRLPLR